MSSRKLLSVPSLPTLPAGFSDLLAKGVDGIAADAARRVQQQLAHHDFRQDGEAWLSEGLPHIVADRCPFCATPLCGTRMIHRKRVEAGKSVSVRVDIGGRRT